MGAVGLKPSAYATKAAYAAYPQITCITAYRTHRAEARVSRLDVRCGKPAFRYVSLLNKIVRERLAEIHIAFQQAAIA